MVDINDDTKEIIESILQKFSRIPVYDDDKDTSVSSILQRLLNEGFIIISILS